MARIVEGGRVRVGERELVVAKATCRVSLDAQGALEKLVAAGGAVEAQAAVLEVIFRPTWPEVTVEAILEEVLLEELPVLLTEAMTAAGFKARPPGEAPSP